MVADLIKINNWSEIFDDPETLARTATENYTKNEILAKGYTDSLLPDWDIPDYFTSG